MRGLRVQAIGSWVEKSDSSNREALAGVQAQLVDMKQRLDGAVSAASTKESELLTALSVAKSEAKDLGDKLAKQTAHAQDLTVQVS